MDQKQTDREQNTKDDWNDKNRAPQADQLPAREPLAPPEADDEEDEDVEDDDRFQATDN